ncbi:DUF4176 domain-containing protein [Lacrimispora sp.]|jgi:hypothetical protein|uniref:DUF4176 domain-containing protein n=1 Tax=Lacrimispora sp. TaxID=2719234 RepID=UPI00289E4633|nr:DUF4176 domain-containing protein [Lacrimispora sp.]
MEKQYILPIGTVVQTKNGNVKLMIVGRAQLFNNNGTIGYFDYSALIYPEGVTKEQEFAFFNHEDIKEIYFEGYRDDVEIKFAEKYDENIQKSLYPKLRLEYNISSKEEKNEINKKE